MKYRNNLDNFTSPLMNILKRPLVCLDLEATTAYEHRVDPVYDRIVQIGIVKLHPDTRRVTTWETLIHPGCEISPWSTAIHGITNEMVKDAPSFESVARFLHRGLKGCDLLGYNLGNYDLPLLYEEFYRAKLPWELDDARIVDASGIFRRREPRTLEAAVQFYCKREHEGAHGALADAAATLEVLDGQLERYKELAEAGDVGALASESYEEKRVDFAGKLIRNAAGELVFNFGRVKGVRVADDPGFARWMLSKDFPLETLRHLEAFFDEQNPIQPIAPDPATRTSTPF